MRPVLLPTFLLALASAVAQQQPPGLARDSLLIHGTRWGMSRDDVRKHEAGEPFESYGRVLSYSAYFNGDSAWLRYRFKDTQLVEQVVTVVRRGMLLDYAGTYDSMRSWLMSVFGPPTSDSVLFEFLASESQKARLNAALKSKPDTTIFADGISSRERDFVSRALWGLVYFRTEWNLDWVHIRLKTMAGTESTFAIEATVTNPHMPAD